MFSFFGWVDLLPTYDPKGSVEEEEAADLALKAAVEKIRCYIEAEYKFPASVYETNNAQHLATSGNSNHYRTQPLELFEFVRSVAPASYGLLYIRDDEDKDGWENAFQAWVLKKGTLDKTKDTFLSPCFPAVED